MAADAPPQIPQVPHPASSLIEVAARVQSLESLAALLRDLRRRHARANRDSSLTYRELAQRTGCSLAAIAEYFTARTLPPTDRFDALLAVLGAAPAELRALADARDRVEEIQRRIRKGGPDEIQEQGRSRASSMPLRQLPADTGLFTGRAEELEALLTLARQDPVVGGPGTVVISAIDGMAGIGKTTLAVHAGHLLAAQFPDGQLFLDLYGFTQDRLPREAGDALAEVLGALGVPPNQIPAQVEARAALYRERLAGTRTLVVLDNAADEAQVQPLLPAAAGCLVLVTSRRSLKALDDAEPLPLDVLSPVEAVSLLRRAARKQPYPADEDGRWEQVAELCGHLPLALVIAGALLRTGGKAWSLDRLIDRLTTRRLGNELAGYTDEVRDLSAVFDLSYRVLGEEERALFRRLGLLPGAQIDAYAAAALLDTDLAAADLLVQRLADHSLLTGSAPGRYQVHDLIRAQARTLAVTLDPESERDRAFDRLLHYYAHTAQSASLFIARHPRPDPQGPAPAHAPVLSGPDAALAWLRTEHRTLDAAFTHADTHGLDAHTIALACGLAAILRIDGPWPRALAVHQAAAAAAQRTSLRTAQAHALTDLGVARYLGGEYAQATDTLTSALEICRETGHRPGEATALLELGTVRGLLGDFAGACDALTLALEIYRETDHRLGTATSLLELGRVRGLVGEYPQAVDAATLALEIFREIGHRLGEATSLTELGRVRCPAGDYSGAADTLTLALGIYREIGNRLGEANALNELGRAWYPIGEYAKAANAQTLALGIYREIGNRLGEADALTELGRVQCMVGEYTEAANAQSLALEIYRGTGNRGNEAWALNHYAATLAAAGDRPGALAHYRQALAMNRELNKSDDEAISLEGIAEHHLAEGATAQGAAYLHQALEIFQRLGMRADAERVTARLAAVGLMPD